MLPLLPIPTQTGLGGRLLTCLCCAALAAGCTRTVPKGTVEGTVQLDSKPIKEGLIRFVSVDGSTQPADGPIVDGKFKVEVPVGEKKVEVTAAKVIGKRKMYDVPDAKEVDDVAELLPDRYNVRSELQMTVERGIQKKDFDLKSK